MAVGVEMLDETLPLYLTPRANARLRIDSTINQTPLQRVHDLIWIKS